MDEKVDTAMSDEEGEGGLRHRLAGAELDSGDSGGEDEVDEEALALRRQRMRQRAMTKVQEEEEVC